MGALDGKVAWLTGAGSGIGRAGAQELASAGATVIVSGRTPQGLTETVALITKAGGKAEPAALDVADKSAVAKLGAEILARHGHVDILVNSAGLNLSTRLWKDMTPDSFDYISGINLNGALYCIYAALPAMRAQKSGLVINVSSWAGRFEEYLTGPAYNASKTALAALTHSLNDEECVNGIRACCIYPARWRRRSCAIARSRRASERSIACCRRKISARRSASSPKCRRGCASTKF